MASCSRSHSACVRTTISCPSARRRRNSRSNGCRRRSLPSRLPDPLCIPRGRNNVPGSPGSPSSLPAPGSPAPREADRPLLKVNLPVTDPGDPLGTPEPLLALAEVPLGDEALVDRSRGDHDPVDPGSPDQVDPDRLDVDVGPVRPADAYRRRSPRVSPLEDLPEGDPGLLEIVGVDELEGALSQGVPGRIPEDAAPGVRLVGDPAVAVDDPDDVGRVLDQGSGTAARSSRGRSRRTAAPPRAVPGGRAADTAPDPLLEIEVDPVVDRLDRDLSRPRPVKRMNGSRPNRSRTAIRNRMPSIPGIW